MLIAKLEMKMTSLMVGLAQWEGVKKLAKSERVSRAAVVREAIDVYLKKSSRKNNVA